MFSATISLTPIIAIGQTLAQPIIDHPVGAALCFAGCVCYMWIYTACRLASNSTPKR
jgi:hypothetical protein